MQIIRPFKQSRIFYLGPFWFGWTRGEGRFGYHRRWKWLAPISTRVKLGVIECEWCLRRRGVHVCSACKTMDAAYEAAMRKED